MEPINWLLSNCLSFRGCPCPGPSVQTHHPSRGDFGKHTRTVRLKSAHLAAETQPVPQTHICEGGSSGQTDNITSQSYKMIHINWFPPSTSSVLPARWYWNVEGCQVFGRTLLFCFFLLTRTVRPNDLWRGHRWFINSVELQIKRARLCIYTAGVRTVSEQRYSL